MNFGQTIGPRKKCSDEKLQIFKKLWEMVSSTFSATLFASQKIG